MARKKKEQVTAAQTQETAKTIVGYRFSPDLLTINAAQIAFMFYRIGLDINTASYSKLGDLAKHFQPIWGEAPPVANVEQESQGAQTTAAST